MILIFFLLLLIIFLSVNNRSISKEVHNVPRFCIYLFTIFRIYSNWKHLVLFFLFQKKSIVSIIYCPHSWMKVLYKVIYITNGILILFWEWEYSAYSIYIQNLYSVTYILNNLIKVIIDKNTHQESQSKSRVTE